MSNFDNAIEPYVGFLELIIFTISSVLISFAIGYFQWKESKLNGPNMYTILSFVYMSNFHNEIEHYGAFS
jgi:hypothetical protein